jgi:hypothetical protein
MQNRPTHVASRLAPSGPPQPQSKNQGKRAQAGQTREPAHRTRKQHETAPSGVVTRSLQQAERRNDYPAAGLWSLPIDQTSSHPTTKRPKPGCGKDGSTRRRPTSATRNRQ